MGYLNSIPFIILSITLYQYVLHLPVAANNVLTPGDVLNNIDLKTILVSPNGDFTLGFFSTKYNLFYLGIWYTNEVQGIKVWIANRDTPIIGTGVLLIDNSGSLKVVNDRGITLFNIFYNQIGSGNKIRAKLEDSGNFVVYDEATTQNNGILWQSFDHPIDILLDGMKLGYNITTKQNWTLTSSLNNEVPATGAFTMKLEYYENSPQLLIYRREELYWANIIMFTDGIFKLISDPSGMYIYFNSTVVGSSTLQLTPTGQFIDRENNIERPRYRYYTPEFCSGNPDSDSEGCKVSALPYCRDSKIIYSWETGYSIQDSNKYVENNNPNISIGDCMKICWNDCNCAACSTNDNGTGCKTWTREGHFYVDKFGDYLDFDSANPTKVYVLASTSKTNNVLTPGDELNNTDLNTILVSPNGDFTLGFFSTNYTLSPWSNFFYLGIWYTGTNGEQGIKVWVANRNNPIIGTGVLLIDNSGSLKVVNDRGITLFNILYNQIGSGKKIRAELKDSGNFVVYDEATTQNNGILWQSFDHPTDVLLSGMKIGYNTTTKQNWTLTSSLNSQVPATDAFTMKLEYYENSPQLLIYRRGELYWASGLWTNQSLYRRFMQEALVSRRFTDQLFNLISDPSGMYIYYNSVGVASSTLLLTPTGRFTGGENDYFTPQFCYGYPQSYDYDNGCKVSVLPYCRDSQIRYNWEAVDSWQYYNGYVEINDNPNISIGDCMKICWNDCNCTACSTNDNGTGCKTWAGEAAFDIDTTYNFDFDFYSADPSKVYVLVSYKAPKSKTWIWVIISLVGMLTSVLLTYLCCKRIRRRRFEEKEIKKREDFLNQLIGSNSFNFSDELEKGLKEAPDVKIFSLKAILAATGNFSDDNKLGQGGYGPVYKGQLFDGRKIAIKRLSKTSGQGLLEFKSELILISKLQHTNLVRLYGCCVHEEEKMLIYEFMPNKSLDFFLFDKDGKVKIDWQIRFNIIEGIAQGLLYLHKYSRMRVIHRDLKVSNVLLDENMNPKIADFGMARIFQSNVTEGTTHRIVGTYGYMAPEYAMKGIFSIKSDVFSFGVLVLEIISGKKNSSFYKYDTSLTLVEYTWELWKREAVLELMDESLGESYDVKQLHRCIHVGLLCVQDNPNDRPTMFEVISMLNNEILDLPIPQQPVFSIQPNSVQPPKLPEHLLGNNIQVSVNEMTLTTMEAR